MKEVCRFSTFYTTPERQGFADLCLSFFGLAAVVTCLYYTLFLLSSNVVEHFSKKVLLYGPNSPVLTVLCVGGFCWETKYGRPLNEYLVDVILIKPLSVNERIFISENSIKGDIA